MTLSNWAAWTVYWAHPRKLTLVAPKQGDHLTVECSNPNKRLDYECDGEDFHTLRLYTVDA